jgi:hypothetical protein
VNVADAELAPSVAAIVCEPAGDAGVVYTLLKDPVVSEVAVIGPAPSKVIVIVELAAKPYPVTVVGRLECPPFGDREIVGVFTVYVVVAVLMPSVALIVCGPNADIGTVYGVAKEPVKVAVVVAVFPPS